MLRAMSTLIVSFLVGVENFVMFLLPRAIIATSTLASGFAVDEVRRGLGPGTVGDSDCVDEEDVEDAE